MLGVFGGTFDPIHIGHLILAQEILIKFKLKEILFIPSKIPPHKKTLCSEFHRVNMVKLAIEDNPFFKLSTIEIDRDKISYTYDTIRELKKIYKNTKIFFIIGADNIKNIPKWYKAEELIKICNFIIGDRPGFPKDKVLNEVSYFFKEKIKELRKNFISIPLINISSKMIRERIKYNIPIKYLVPSKVEKYIKENKLYL